MDFSEYGNPYDFSNPVLDEQLFIGREKELEDIRYYLDHAKKTGRAINIALLGPRASGKTSLLNMTEKEAKKRELITVRLNLDEGVVENELRFFFKIFDAVFSAACGKGAYCGKDGETSNRYLEMICTFTVPQDKTFCPLNFPIRYAMAMRQNNERMPVPDTMFTDDLQAIYNEVKVPFVLLFDECNVLSDKRILLEKTRNIFMNLNGFMLVFAGTPELFPTMDEVFSPIIRQFKKINIGSFSKVEDSWKCVTRPLESIGIDPSNIIHPETNSNREEIHQIAGGKPYEIQLICHIMFRRVAMKQAKEMRLDLDTIEELLAELESSQDLTNRPKIKKIKQLKDRDLVSLNRLCVCNGEATLDQLWTLSYILKGDKAPQKQKLVSRLECLVKDDLIECDSNGILRFRGDEFERIFAKYLSRKRKLPLDFPEFSLEGYWHHLLHGICLNKSFVEVSNWMVETESNIDVCEITNKMSVEENFFLRGHPFLVELYELMFDYRGFQTIPIMEIGVNLGWLNVSTFFYAPDPNNSDSVKRLAPDLDEMTERARSLGYQVDVRLKEITVIPTENLASKIEKLTSESIRNVFGLIHETKMVSSYIEENDLEKALFHAEVAIRYHYEMNADVLNNVGYILLRANKLDKAKQFFERAIATSKSELEQALPTYNSGILEAMAGNYAVASHHFENCLSPIKSHADTRHRFARLMFPIVSRNYVTFDEQTDCDIISVARKAKLDIDTLSCANQGYTTS